MPLLHRNTMHFNGMGERSFYLAFKKHGNKMFALDKANNVSCWSMTNGQLLSRIQSTADYREFEVDKEIYDKNWFPFTVISKPLVP